MTDIHLDSPEALEQALHVLRQVELNGSHKLTVTKIAQTRTAQQNRALHLWLRQVSAELNARHLDVPYMLKHAVDLDWDEDGEAFKRLVWAKIQKVMTGNDKTSKANKPEYPQVFEVVNRWLAKEGVHVPWPTTEGKT